MANDDNPVGAKLSGSVQHCADVPVGYRYYIIAVW